MRWLWFSATVFAALICFTRHSAGAMAAWLLISLLGAIFTALVFVQARIESGNRPDPLLDLQMKKRGDGDPPPL